MASNINQMTKLANTTKQVPEQRVLGMLKGELRELRNDIVRPN